MALAGAVNLSMMIMAAGLFHNSGLVGIDSIDGAFDGLKQLVSPGAATVFGIALLASGFASSSVGTMAGQVVMQGFIRRRIPIFVRRAITLAPALIVLGVGLDPTDALVGSQVVLSFGIPFALVPLVLLASRRELMGSLDQPALADRAGQRPVGADHLPQRLPAGAALLRVTRVRAMALAADFQEVVDALPDDWTDLALDLRIADETRYVDAAVMLSQVNAQPYSRAEWHWRINVAHRFGHAAAAETVRGILSKLDREGIDGEMRVRDAQEGRAEVVQMWGRPESVRRDFQRRRSLPRTAADPLGVRDERKKRLDHGARADWR